MANIFDLFKQIETPKVALAPITHIVIGLGNIGKQYEKTRHNIGFLAIDYIAEKWGGKIDRLKFNATVGEVVVGDKRVLLMKPTTFMNNSGVAAKEAADFYKIPPERVIILHDEISFDPGVIRIRRKGSAGGHNGLKSLISHLGSEEFPRIKIGVGKKPTPEYDLVDFVLGKFPDSDLEAIEKRFSDIESATREIIDGNIDSAMNKYSK